MIRFGIFVSVVSALYMIGQKEQTTPHVQPAAIPMTLTLDGTWIGAPKRPETDWKSDMPFRDRAPMPAGFDQSVALLVDQTGLATASITD